MENNPGDTPSDDFFEQILGFSGYSASPKANLAGTGAPPATMMLQLGSGDGSHHLGGIGGLGVGIGGGYGVGGGFPLGLSLEQGKGGFHDVSGSEKRFLRDDVTGSRASFVKAAQGFHGQPVANTVPPMPHPPAARPRVRARRGQATDPHSIAERLRREKIAERIRALQDLVPTVNKADRAAMLDEIVDYVKFLRLQVKVLSMSRLGGPGAVAPLVTDIPLSSVPEEGNNGIRSEPGWEKWSNDGTEQQVAKLMEEDIGAAMQFLQSKALCIMPMPLASVIHLAQQPLDTPTPVRHEPNPSN